MSTTKPKFEVVAPCGVSNEFESRQKAEEGIDTHEALCEECEEGSAEIKAVGDTAETDGGPQANGTIKSDTDNAELSEEAMRKAQAEVVTDNDEEATEPVEHDLPENQPTVDQDPVDWMPSHFVDEIQNVPTVNRKGYAVIASQYGVSVEAEPVTLASETEFTFAEFRAVAETIDGETYTGFGSAHVDRQDGDDEHLLNELAETRAMKRAVAWATGVGMTAVEELKGEL